MKIDVYLLDRYFKYTKFVSTPMLGVLEAWTRALGHEVRVTTCGEEGVDVDTDADAVAVSVYTFMAPAAYRAAAKLRNNGKVVILGGPHFHGPRTVEEARNKCDAVVETICREQWADLLGAIEAGRLRPGAERARHIVDADNRFDFPDNMHETYSRIERRRFPLLMASIGCPFRCEFCNPYSPGRYRLRDTDTVARELGSIRGRYAAFCDATFGLNKKHTGELMRKIAPLGKLLFIQTALGCLGDPELLDALYIGGVRWISVGIETFSEPQKKHGRNSAHDDVDRLSRLIGDIKKRGMSVQGNFILGMDTDGPGTFDAIKEFYATSGLDTIIADIMVPFPNTILHERLEREGRILDRDWEHYDFHHVVYEPRCMSMERLIEGYVELYRTVTGGLSLMRKCAGIVRNVGVAAAFPPVAWNVMNHLDARRKEASLLGYLKEVNPAEAGGESRHHAEALAGCSTIEK